jgi:hypothetical protein
MAAPAPAPSRCVQRNDRFVRQKLTIVMPGLVPGIQCVREDALSAG